MNSKVKLSYSEWILMGREPNIMIYILMDEWNPLYELPCMKCILMGEFDLIKWNALHYYGWVKYLYVMDKKYECDLLHKLA